jgi:hypothetical protein
MKNSVALGSLKIIFGETKMPSPANQELYERAKEIVYAQYTKPSAYRSMALQKKYKELGGTYIGKKSKGELTRWQNEKWQDVGGKDYPVYRPTKRVRKATPLTVAEIDPVHLQSQIQLKQKIKGSRNLPPFQKKNKT